MKLLIKNEEKENAIIPLFKLIPGISKESYAFYCAKQNGVAESIINRAKEISECILNKSEIKRVDKDTERTEMIKYEKILNYFNERRDWNENEVNTLLNMIKKS